MSVTTNKINVSLLDTKRQNAPHRDKILAAMTEVFDSGQYILGPKVTQLENEIAAYCETKHAIGVSSGTDALIIALMGLDIGPGDEVITSPFTFFATLGSITRVGATPVFVDIDPYTFNIDPKQIEAKITDKTKAIIPVHLFGQVADMTAIMAIAEKNNLRVIEDGAQAIGAKHNGQQAGSFGDVGCFSFFPSKNLGGCGDGGIVTTNSSELYEKMKILRVHGSKPKYYHKLIGGNFRLDPLQAVILSIKLPHLNQQHADRQAHAAVYNSELHESITAPVVAKESFMIYNQYSILSKTRDALQEYLGENGISSAIYYPVPLHLQECFSELKHKEGDFPISERIAKQILSIPIYPEMTKDERAHVIKTINRFSN
ncbi:MAG: dTDP-4-amino-4,6-dideoxygalactose transaminase [Candidatus Marinamargulisbacteria bacterium]|jgi:dTDP-4-amino-4,6-dideoxygalactose transaminase